MTDVELNLAKFCETISTYIRSAAYNFTAARNTEVEWAAHVVNLMEPDFLEFAMKKYSKASKSAYNALTYVGFSWYDVHNCYKKLLGRI